MRYEHLLLNRHVARKGTLLIAFAITVLSIMPAGLRPVVASHNFEHITIYLALGLSAGLSYLPRFAVYIFGALASFCIIIEVLQLGIPGRHARIEDLALDLIASQFGFALAALLCQFGRSRS
jgi:VanZ family protein